MYASEVHHTNNKTTNQTSRKQPTNQSINQNQTNRPEVNEDVDQAPVVHPVRALIAPTLNKSVLPIPPLHIMTHQQPAPQRRERAGHKWRAYRSKPLTPARTIIAKQCLQRGQWRNLRSFLIRDLRILLTRDLRGLLSRPRQRNQIRVFLGTRGLSLIV